LTEKKIQRVLGKYLKLAETSDKAERLDIMPGTVVFAREKGSLPTFTFLKVRNILQESP
jgi:hypothetical protein